MDEKGFLLGVLGKTKRVYTKDGGFNKEKLKTGQDGSRDWISLIATICQDGSSLPPWIIYPSDSGTVLDTWLEDFKPDQLLGWFSASESGWTNHQLAQEWLVKLFDRFTRKKARNQRDTRLLITDGHSSHLNIDFLDLCERLNIVVCILPPHSTHRLQPLDVGIFSPLATTYSHQLANWLSSTCGLISLSKRHF